MATAKQKEILTTRRRNKEPGVLSSLWSQTGSTLINSGSTVENTVGIMKDSLVLGREMLKPSVIDAKVETLSAYAEGIADLLALGVDEEEAKKYLSTAM